MVALTAPKRKNYLKDYLTNIEYPKLSEMDKGLLDKDFEIEELDRAASGLNNNSAPGYDGITNQFYKFFWKKLRRPLFECLKYSVETKGELSPTQRLGIITLIHKGKDLSKDDIKNWRPITLTNSDYKIFSKILANRLQMVVKSIVNPNQTGFIKKRSIEDHIRSIDDICSYTVHKNIPGIITTLDFQKAFDTISHDSIINALECFNFGKKLYRPRKSLA